MSFHLTIKLSKLFPAEKHRHVSYSFTLYTDWQTEYHVTSLLKMFVLASDNNGIMDDDVKWQAILYQVVIITFIY